MDFIIPSSEPKITKEYLLSKNSEETYMSTYLGIPVKQGLQISPLRTDHKPTASFHRNKNGQLMFHDFGTGFHEDFIGVVMEIYKCTYNQALQIIAEDFNLIPKNNDRVSPKLKISNVILEEKPSTQIQITDKPFSKSELSWWKSFGISQQTLKKFKVHSCDSVFLNGNYFGSSTSKSSMFGYYCGTKNGEELWRIYMPQRKTYRFLSNTGKNFIQGSKQLPDTGDLLVITKSMKDVMALYEFGIPAIAPCSEVLFISKQQLKKLKERFKHIIVMYDNDLPGIEGMRKIKKQYPELKFFWIPRKYKAKDTSDFIKKYGVYKTKEYIEKLKVYYEC